MTSKQKPLRRLGNSLWRVFHKDDPKAREAIDTLRQVPMFSGLPRGALRHLADSIHRRDYKRNEILYYENDPGLGLYVVQQGRIRLLVEDESGAVQEMRQVAEYEAFGKLSLLGDFRRIETAQALTDTRVLGFFRPDLMTILKRHPVSGASILEALARNLAALERDMIRVLAEKDGKIEAMRLIHGAAARVDQLTTDVV